MGWSLDSASKIGDAAGPIVGALSITAVLVASVPFGCNARLPSHPAAEAARGALALAEASLESGAAPSFAKRAT